MRMWVWSLALLSGLRIRQCHELWCRSQMRLGAGVAVAGSCSSNSTLSLGTSIYCKCGPKKKKKKKRKRISGILFLAWYLVSLDEWCLQNLLGGILLVVFHPVTSGLFQIHLLLSLTLLYHNQPISKSLSLSTSLHLQPDLNYHQLSLGLCSPNFPSIDLCSI